MSRLPVNLADLLRQRTIEGERIEYKAGWNPDAVIRTLCAFANDFENLGGGYLVIGQDCDADDFPIASVEEVEGRSTGIPKILKVMAANGSPAPLFESDEDRLSFVIRLPCHPLAAGEVLPTAQVTAQVTGDVTEEVRRLLLALVGEMSRQQLLEALGMTHREHFRNAYLKPAMDAGLVEMTRPDKPNSSHQRYRRTPLGRRWLEV